MSLIKLNVKLKMKMCLSGMWCHVFFKGGAEQLFPSSKILPPSDPKIEKKQHLTKTIRANVWISIFKWRLKKEGGAVD